METNNYYVSNVYIHAYNVLNPSTPGSLINLVFILYFFVLLVLSQNTQQTCSWGFHHTVYIPALSAHANVQHCPLPPTGLYPIPIFNLFFQLLSSFLAVWQVEQGKTGV